jgi:hypothetical protein
MRVCVWCVRASCLLNFPFPPPEIHQFTCKAKGFIKMGMSARFWSLALYVHAIFSVRDSCTIFTGDFQILLLCSIMWFSLQCCQHLKNGVSSRVTGAWWTGEDLERSRFSIIEALSLYLHGGPEEIHGKPQCYIWCPGWDSRCHRTSWTFANRRYYFTDVSTHNPKPVSTHMPTLNLHLTF